MSAQMERLMLMIVDNEVVHASSTLIGLLRLSIVDSAVWSSTYVHLKYSSPR